VQAIATAIRGGDGLVVVTGESGVGKTTLVRAALAQAGGQSAVALVPIASDTTREDLLTMLLVEFGVVAPADVVRRRNAAASRAELSCLLTEWLRGRARVAAPAVAVLDDAGQLAPGVVDEIRILTELDGAAARLLRVVLVGGPGLSAALQRPGMRPLRERVTVVHALHALRRDDVHGYVPHRLRLAGTAGAGIHLTDAALDLVYEATGGMPRSVNRVCDVVLRMGNGIGSQVFGPDRIGVALAELRPAAPAPAHAPHAAIPELPIVAAHVFARAWALSALVVLGLVSGASLAIYWTWARPLLSVNETMPAVPRPTLRVGSPLPAVLPPASETGLLAAEPPSL
jgi:type II secretory pathway predicted ATPase ExeA